MAGRAAFSAAGPRGNELLQQVGIPALFVVLWSTGFIGARLGLPHAEPLTFLTLRYALVVGLLLLLALATGAPWPQRWSEVAHYAVAGLLVHAVYLGGVFVAISLGVEAGVSALIVGIQPLLTAALAGVFLRERVSARQWGGLCLGLLGVGLVLADKLGQGPGSALGSLACIASLFAITLGTLYQKRYCAGMDLRKWQRRAIPRRRPRHRAICPGLRGESDRVERRVPLRAALAGLRPFAGRRHPNVCPDPSGGRRPVRQPLLPGPALHRPYCLAALRGDAGADGSGGHGRHGRRGGPGDAPEDSLTRVSAAARTCRKRQLLAADHLPGTRHRY